MASKDIVDAAGFAEALQTPNTLILADFWAEWCGPCKMLSPVLHTIADKFPETVLLLKVNVDEPGNQALAMQYEVRSIPQVTFFLNGANVDQFVWVFPPAQVEALVQKHLATLATT